MKSIPNTWEVEAEASPVNLANSKANRMSIARPRLKNTDQYSDQDGSHTTNQWTLDMPVPAPHQLQKLDNQFCPADRDHTARTPLYPEKTNIFPLAILTPQLPTLPPEALSALLYVRFQERV